MMGVATTCIGLLPSYLQIGIWAPIALVALRIIQGIAVGGEWGGAILIASESAPKGKGILYAAFAQQGSPAGNLLATLVFFGLSALPTPDFLLWGWRIPFLLSALLVIVGMVIRLKLEESDDMKRLMAQKKTVKLPILEVLRDHWRLVLLGAGVLPIIHVTYFKSTFALSWATKELGYSQSSFLSVIVIALVVQFITQPLGAVLVSRIDMRKAMVLMVVPELLLMPAMFFAVETGNYWIAVLGMCLATVPHSMFYGAVGGILARAFPTRVRYSGLSISYQLCSLLVAAPPRCWHRASSMAPAASSAWPSPRPATPWSRCCACWPCSSASATTPPSCPRQNRRMPTNCCEKPTTRVQRRRLWITLLLPPPRPRSRYKPLADPPGGGRKRRSCSSSQRLRHRPPP